VTFGGQSIRETSQNLKAIQKASKQAATAFEGRAPPPSVRLR